MLLEKFFGTAGEVTFYKSGRSALSAVFEALALEQAGSQVLVPDYICNVVPRAISRAGLHPVPYHTTKAFEPDMTDLLGKLADPSVTAVLLASVFGSQNTSQPVIDRIRQARAQILVVLDDCQNLVLNRSVPLDVRTVFVFSFNQKTLAGAMGGGILWLANGLDLHRPKPEWARDFRLECAVALVFFRQACLRTRTWLRRFLGTQCYPPPTLEYSSAAGRIHYDMSPQRIARVSLVRALVRMKAAAQTESQRKRNYEALRAFLQQTGAGELIPTAVADSTPLVPVRLLRPEFSTRLPWKGPYALDRDPYKTLQPNLVCFKNDGLDSFSDLVN